MVPEVQFVQFMEEQLNRTLLPKLGYPGLEVELDLSGIEVLREDENSRVARDAQLLDRGVLSFNEVRRSRDLPDVPWGDVWARAPRGTDLGVAEAYPNGTEKGLENGLLSVKGAGSIVSGTG